MRAALYARFSSDKLQRVASIDDQLRICRERAHQLGAEVVAEFTDPGISGFSIKNRPGITALLEGARAGDFDMVIAEALDRVSRDLEDTAYVYKRLVGRGVRLVTLAEGDHIGTMHVAFKGATNADFLKDLAAKIQRGQRGRAIAGAAMARAYGYDVVRAFGPDGQPVRGRRRINAEQAAIVLRIFGMYVAGVTTREIARTLNAEGVAPPRGRAWNYSGILGSPTRLTGILNNPLYAGRLIYGRQSFRKDPDTARRVGRLNERSAWTVVDAPELRIVPEDLWAAAQARRTARSREAGEIHQVRQPRRLLSGLVFCGACGCAYHTVTRDYLACGAHAGNLTCSNARTVRHAALEQRVLAGLADKLLTPAREARFKKRYVQAWKTRAAEIRRRGDAGDRQRGELDARIKRLVGAIEDGTDTPELRRRLRELTAERKRLPAPASAPSASAELLPFPNLAETYRRRVQDLAAALAADTDARRHAEASETIRALVGKIVVHPGPKRGEVKVDLHPSLAAMLAIAVPQLRQSTNHVFDASYLVTEEPLVIAV